MHTFKEVTIYFGLPDENDISLADILACIPLGPRREWSLLYIRATGRPGDFDMPSLEVEAEIHGKIYGWEELSGLHERFEEVTEMMVCGGERVGHLRKTLPFGELLESAEYVIELMDGGFWVVHTSNDQAIGNFREKFPRVEVVDL